MEYVLPVLTCVLFLLILFRQPIKRGFRPRDRTPSEQKFAEIIAQEKQRLRERQQQSAPGAGDETH